jgi:hypothetical protein
LTGLELVTTIEQLLEELVDGTQQAMGVIIGLDESAVESHSYRSWGQHRESKFTTSICHWWVRGECGCSVECGKEQGAKQARRLVAGRALHTPYMNEVANG